MPRRWLVTGCSSGLGRELAEQLAEAGECVTATARRSVALADLTARYPENLVTIDLDVRSDKQCAAAVALAQERFGGIDVLVNNAGYGQFGTVEEISDDELSAQFATNLFGPWRLTRMVLPLLRAQLSGHVFFVSSVVGSMALPGLSAYTASKFAQEGLAESLAQETAHLGITVTILQLGAFATPYGRSMLEPADSITAYDQAKGGILGMFRSMQDNADLNPPSLFATTVRRLVEITPLPLRVPIGDDAAQHLAGAMEVRRSEFERAVAEGLHRSPVPSSTLPL